MMVGLERELGNEQKAKKTHLVAGQVQRLELRELAEEREHAELVAGQVQLLQRLQVVEVVGPAG